MNIKSDFLLFPSRFDFLYILLWVVFIFSLFPSRFYLFWVDTRMRNENGYKVGIYESILFINHRYFATDIVKISNYLLLSDITFIFCILKNITHWSFRNLLFWPKIFFVGAVFKKFFLFWSGKTVPFLKIVTRYVSFSETQTEYCIELCSISFLSLSSCTVSC